MKRYCFLLCSLSFLFFGQLNAQNELPKYPTKDEVKQKSQYTLLHQPKTGIETPPQSPVRPMAEWEELQAILISWEGHQDILAEITRAASQECRVVIACDNANEINQATTYLNNRNIDLTNVELTIIPTNSIWIRDYGPNCVYKNTVDSLYLVDWIYNRNRALDDVMAAPIADYLNVPLYSTTAPPYDLVHTGGNFMTDGINQAFSSKLVFEENDGTPDDFGFSTHDEHSIDTILNRFMGIEKYAKMDILPFDVIHHIDMHIKLLDEERLLVGQYPSGIADGPQIEANIQYVLSNYQTAFGTDFKTIRIPMPPDQFGRYPNTGGYYRTYTNSLIVNKTILVPFYEEKYDTTAQRIWENTMPGYTIVGIDCNDIIWKLGALHCITKEIGVQSPLRIVHQALPCQNNNSATSYFISADIQHRSGIENAAVHWSTNPNGPFETIDMFQGIVPHIYMANIPLQTAGNTIYYYIEAKAYTGKIMRRPMVAPEGTWSFCVEQTIPTTKTTQIKLQTIFPNPASAITCIPVFSTEKTEAKISLLNSFGQQLELIFSGILAQGSSKYFIDAAAYPAGTYWVRVHSEQGSYMQKFVIK